MKVLILSITAGQGHHQTALAISDYLKSKGADCNTLDVLEYIDPAIRDICANGYLISTKHIPIAYGGFYSIADKRYKKREMTVLSITSSLMAKKLSRYVAQTRPDAIICTHVFAAQVITKIKGFTGLTVGIITDFTIHPYWDETRLDYYVTASELLTLQAEKKRIPAEKILPIGIPIQEKFSRKISKSEARRQLGIEDKTTILVMSGSMGYGNLYKHIKRMDGLKLDFQMMCVCGHNAGVKKSIDKIAPEHKIFNHGYVENVDIMMDAADLMVTKPGGLTVSEALAKKLPMILMNPIPGQEERNAEFLLNNGIAMMMTKTCPVDECLYQMLVNNWRYNFLRDIVTYVGKPDAAKNLGDFVMQHAKN